MIPISVRMGLARWVIIAAPGIFFYKVDRLTRKMSRKSPCPWKNDKIIEIFHMHFLHPCINMQRIVCRRSRFLIVITRRTHPNFNDILS